MPREHPLARVDRELKVAPRHRLDLIEEVDADVTALQAELERRGHSPVRARRTALDQLVPGAEALDRLEARHAPRTRRWARAAAWLDPAVRLGVGAATALTAAATFRIGASGSSGGTAVLLWSHVFLAALLAANLAWTAARIWIHADLRPAGRRLLWARQGGLIVAAVAVGALGAAWKGYLHFAGADPATISPLSAWGAVAEMARVAAIGLGTAIFGLFGWLAIAMYEGEVGAATVWEGVGITVGPTIFGFLILGIAAVAWLALQWGAGRKSRPAIRTR